MKKIIFIIFICLFSSTTFAKTLVCITDDKKHSMTFELIGKNTWCKVWGSEVSDICSSGKETNTIYIIDNIPLGQITTKINRYTGKFTEDWKFKEKFPDGSDSSSFKGDCTLNKKKKF